MSSLRDIANALDLSVSMVSKVLSGRMGTSGAPAETVRAIRAKAAELNYHKNVSAAALAASAAVRAFTAPISVRKVLTSRPM